MSRVQPRQHASSADPTADLFVEILGRSPTGFGPSSPSGPSIHDVLAPRLEAMGAGDVDALAPSSVVDETLGHLVDLVTITADDWGRGADEADGFHRQVVDRIGAELASSPESATRASVVRRAAAAAEAAMEAHFARLIIEDGVGRLAATSSMRTIGPDRGARLAEILQPFPYVDNYRLLVGAEQAAVASAPERIVFCGAGPLPLTGIFWHLHTGAEVRLVEVDPAVAALAASLVEVLVGLDAIPAGALVVEVGDAADLDPADADLVIVASLIDNEIVQKLTGKLGAVPRRGGADARRLLLRSARGLVAHFVYERVDVERALAAGLAHVGTIAPRGAVVRGSALGDTDRLSPGGLLADDDPRLLGVADKRVLNTAEVFEIDPIHDRRRGLETTARVPPRRPRHRQFSGKEATLMNVSPGGSGVVTDVVAPPDPVATGAYRIEPAQRSDGSALRRFCLAMIEQAFGQTYRADWHADLDALPSSDHAYRPSRGGAFLVARDGERIVGCGALQRLDARPALAARLSDRFETPDVVGSIWRVYVDPDHRGSGLGSTLAARLESLAADAGYRELYLHTSAATPRSVSFWKRCGYRPFLIEEGRDEVTVHLDKTIGGEAFGERAIGAPQPDAGLAAGSSARLEL